ncbi:hypothetical protein HMPREF9420_2499, partial [Segatella salivae DSM 15606]
GISCFRTFQRAQKIKNHASERFRRLKKRNFMLLNVSESSKIRNSCF